MSVGLENMRTLEKGGKRKNFPHHKLRRKIIFHVLYEFEIYVPL